MPESACLLMALSFRHRVTPCARIQFVPKCIRSPSVLTKRNFISRGGNKKRSARGNAWKCTVQGFEEDFDRS